MLNRKFVRTDDVIKDYEAKLCKTVMCKTATAFTVSQTRERSFSLQIYKSKSKRTWLEAYSFATVEQLQLESTHTHTCSQLYCIPRTCSYQDN